MRKLSEIWNLATKSNTKKMKMSNNGMRLFTSIIRVTTTMELRKIWLVLCFRMMTIPLRTIKNLFRIIKLERLSQLTAILETPMSKNRLIYPSHQCKSKDHQVRRWSFYKWTNPNPLTISRSFINRWWYLNH